MPDADSQERAADESAESTEDALARCPTGGITLALEPETLSPDLESARITSNEARGGGGSWTVIDAIETYSYDRCVRPSPSLAEIVAALPDGTQQDLASLRGETSLDRAAIETSRFLGGPAGEPMLDALDGWARTGARTLSGLERWDEVRCHNCTDHQSLTVLRYRTSRKVVVIRAHYGWDS